MTVSFSITTLPRLHFGTGISSRLPEILLEYGNQILLISGPEDWDQFPTFQKLFSSIKSVGIQCQKIFVQGEPSPRLVDEAVREFRNQKVDAVVGIGGGSVLDTAKAIAGLLIPGNSISDHLEGVGPELPFRGPTTPFIAVPTTAGTGSEATRNAVISQCGENGFKRSFRSEHLVARHALVDPALLETCPPPVIAASGMDAITQLIESYVSLRSNPWTDSLARGALENVGTGLLDWFEGREAAERGRTAMAYAAMVSGITLAQAGLGAVHGVASPLGAFFPIPHGMICGTLAGAGVAINIRAMQERDPHNPALVKYAQLGVLLTQRRELAEQPEAAVEALENILAEWTEQLKVPRLSALGIKQEDLPRIIADCRGSSMKTNPIVLTDREVEQMLRFRL
jgi:alcohol dehydrogenase class IV